MTIRKSITEGSVGDRIASAREKLGLSASDFARRLEVTPTAVWNWEKNGVIPRGPVMRTIANVLGVSEAFLRSGTEDAQSSAASHATLAQVIERAKNDIARAAGLTVDRVKLSVEFI